MSDVKRDLHVYGMGHECMAVLMWCETFAS